MLEDFSQHILDLAENSVNAGASEVRISLSHDWPSGYMVFEIIDNGKGMDPEMLSRVTDPFCTSRTTRRVGLGLPFIKQLCELCEGEFHLDSEAGTGTTLKASFRIDSIDLPPYGDIPATLMSLFVSHPDINWIYTHSYGEHMFGIDSKSILHILGDPERFRDPAVAMWLKDYIKEGIQEICTNNSA